MCAYLDISKRQEGEAEGEGLQVPPVDSMGGAHNVALLSLAEDLPEVHPWNDP